MFVGFALLSAVLEGGGGIAVTELTADINETDTTITVDSTDIFLSSDYIVIEDEEIAYTGKTDTTFTGCTRGYGGTEAAAHSDGTLCQTADASVINHALGYNVATTSATSGPLTVIVIPAKFFTETLPRLIQWNWSFMTGHMAIVGFFFFAASIGLVVTIALAMLHVAQGVLRRS